MPEIDFKPESGESRMQSPSLYQQVEQSFTRNFQQQRNDQTSLKDLGFPDLSIVEASATHPADRHQSTAQQTSARELQLGMMAKAMGIDVTKNRDGSYDVKSPFDNPQQAAGGILNKVFNGLIGGSNDGSAPVGMNPWHARAWQGFPEDPRQRQQEEARRRQEEQQAKQRWERSGR